MNNIPEVQDHVMQLRVTQRLQLTLYNDLRNKYEVNAKDLDSGLILRAFNGVRLSPCSNSLCPLILLPSRGILRPGTKKNQAYT